MRLGTAQLHIVRMLAVVLASWLGVSPAVEPIDDTRVLAVPPATPRTPSALYQRLQRVAQEAIQLRREKAEGLADANALAVWNQERRVTFLAALGGLPDRTDLNAQVVDSFTGDGFRVENIIFESRPQHHVTGNLYLPTTSGPHPVVLVPCGHSYNGKAAEGYQKFSMLLARNGIAAFCYDPIGQGERYQTFTGDGEPLGAHYTGSPSSVRQLEGIPGGPRFNPVEEHTLAGVGAILVGSSTAQFRIWDGMRAIDYVASRPDIDSQRIGCCGNSGGGTLTGYLMALDPRVACAAPVCSLTSFERLLATSGPQDAEQNLFGQLRDGLDQGDFLLMRAPKPTLLCAGTRDATFDIVGTWDLLRESKRVFGRLGYPERVDLAEADEPHGFTRPLRIAATRWMRRWLLKRDDAIDEPELVAFKSERLQCTARGQVLFLKGERSVFDLTRAAAEKLATRRVERWRAAAEAERRDRVRRVAGIRATSDLTTFKVERVARQERDGYVVEKIVIQRNDGVVLPALDFRPSTKGDKPQSPAILYLHDQGKATGVVGEGPVVRWVKAGRRVLAVDIEGLGETYQRHPRDWGGELFGPNTQEFFLAYLVGQSLVGLQAEDVLTVTSFLRTTSEPRETSPVQIEAHGNASRLAALHASFVEPGWFTDRQWFRQPTRASATNADRPEKTGERSGVLAWSDLLTDPAAGDHLTLAIQGVLGEYELADLVAAENDKP